MYPLVMFTPLGIVYATWPEHATWKAAADTPVAQRAGRRKRPTLAALMRAVLRVPRAA